MYILVCLWAILYRIFYLNLYFPKKINGLEACYMKRLLTFKKMALFAISLFISITWIFVSNAFAAEWFQPREVESKNWHLHFSTALRYDSNVVLDPENIGFRADTIVFGGLTGDQDSMAVDLNLRGDYYPIYTPNTRLGIEYTFYQSLYFEHSDFSTQGHFPRIIFQQVLGDLPAYITFSPFYRYYAVEHGTNYFSQAFLLPLSLTIIEGGIAKTEVYYMFKREWFDDAYTEDFIVRNSFLRENYANIAGVAQTFYFMEKRGFVKIGADIRVEDADNPYDQVAPRVYGHVRIPITPSTRFDLKGSFESEMHTNDHRHNKLTLFFPNSFRLNNIKRRDDVTIIKTGFTQQIFGPLSGSLEYMLIVNDSNEVLFNYTRHQAIFTLAVDL